MARGGYRPGAGRPKGAGSRGLKKIPAGDAGDLVRKAGLSPLEYMLRVMNNTEAPSERRDRMAIAAAPFVHGKPGEKDRSKKADREAAADEAAAGRFATPAAPKLVVNNE